MKITESKLRKIINSVLKEEFDNEYNQNDLEQDNNSFVPNSLAFKRRFINNPISAMQYFKDIVSREESDFMNFLHVFLDLMLTLDESLKADRENFIQNSKQLINYFPTIIAEYSNKGHHVDNELLADLGKFFVLFGRKLSERSNISSSQIENDFSDRSLENKTIFPESRTRLNRKKK